MKTRTKLTMHNVTHMHVLLINCRATDCIMAKIHWSHKMGNVCNAQQILEALTMDMVNISVCNH
jgi:hypothetical protein